MVFTCGLYLKYGGRNINYLVYYKQIKSFGGYHGKDKTIYGSKAR